MTTSLTIWHNPRCSKSREALQILEDSGRPFTIRRYLEDSPDATTLRDVLKKLDAPPRELIRSKDAAFKELGLDATLATDDQLIEAMANNPAIIERPVIIAEDRAVIGRPPQNVLKLL